MNQSKEPKPIPPTLFGRNQYNPETRVKSIYSSIFHMAAITTEGNLYTWGKNKWGQLGLGHTKDQYFPLQVNNILFFKNCRKITCTKFCICFQVSVGATVKRVSCGVDHMAALCKPYQ